jgi:hypothetical protein
MPQSDTEIAEKGRFWMETNQAASFFNKEGDIFPPLALSGAFLNTEDDGIYNTRTDR